MLKKWTTTWIDFFLHSWRHVLLFVLLVAAAVSVITIASKLSEEVKNV